MAAPAVDRQQHELINHERRKHKQRLLEGGLGADAQVLAHGDVGHEGEGERVLAEQRALEHIEREAGEEAERMPPVRGAMIDQ